MDKKAKTLRHLLFLFKGLVINLTKDDKFDYYGTPVTTHSDWDYLPVDSVEAVYSIAGNNAPSINTLSGVQETGFVITFAAPIGGNNQLFINKRILAVRQIGNPAGWSYLGLGENSKLYMSEGTANVMTRLFHRFAAPDSNYVDTFSNEEIDGQKDFSALPLFNGKPLVYQDEFQGLDKKVRHNNTLIDRYLGGVENNVTSIRHLRDLYSELENDISDNYVEEDELKSYVPFTQLEYYVPKSDLKEFLTVKNAKVIFSRVRHQTARIAEHYARLCAGKGNSSDSQGNTATYITFKDFKRLGKVVRDVFLAITDLTAEVQNEYASKYVVTTLQGQVEQHNKEIKELEDSKEALNSPDLFPLKHAIDLKIQKVNKWAHDHIPSSSAISSVASSASNATHSLASRVAKNNKWAHDHAHSTVSPNETNDTLLADKLNVVSMTDSNATSNLAGNQDLDEHSLSSISNALTSVASASSTNSASASSKIQSLESNVGSLDTAVSALLMTINNDFDERDD